MERYKKLFITYAFGETSDPLDENNKDYTHRGIDFRPGKYKDVRCGFSGVVREIAFDKRGGLYIQVKSIINGIPFYTNYYHNRTIFPEEKEKVRAAEIIAIAGNTGEVTGEHIHIEICSYALNSNFIKDCKNNVAWFEVKKEGRLFFDPLKLFDYFKKIGVKYEGVS